MNTSVKPCCYCGWPVGRSRPCARHVGYPLMNEKSLWQQLKEIYDRGDEDEVESAHTDELQELRNQEIQSELAHPQCCDLARTYIFPYREFDGYTENVLHGGRPVWKSVFQDGWSERDGLRRLLAMSYCPFCGQKFPALRKKVEPPPHIMDEGDGHCGECGKRYGRFGHCFCSLPESAWEIEG